MEKGRIANIWPDSSRKQAVFPCPYCGNKSSHKLHQELERLPKYTVPKFIQVVDKHSQKHDVQEEMRHYIYKCDVCTSETYFLIREKIEVLNSSVAGPGIGFTPTPIYTEPPQIIHQFPVYSPSMHNTIPDLVKKATIEAEKCFAVGAPNACGTMARRAVDALCQEKKAEGKDVYNRLEDLKNKGILPKELWEWGNQLRIFGKKGAHPEFEELEDSDAEAAVKFLRDLLKYSYVLPYELQRAKEKTVS